MDNEMTEQEELVSTAATPLLASQRSQLASCSGSFRSPRVGFEDSKRLARKPFHIPASGSTSGIDSDSLAIYNRLKYYNKLTAPKDETLKIPDHVVPVMFFYGIPIIFPTDTEGKQSSIVTIFVLWNTMMGTSLLGMPWAISQAGFTTAISLMLAMAGLCLYTAYRVLSVQSKLADFPKGTAEFAEICGHLLGKWASWASVFFSLAALLGAVVVYWVLSTNFLYHIVSFLHDEIVEIPTSVPISNATSPDVICNNAIPVNDTLFVEELNLPSNSTFNSIWDLNKTVPFIMILVLGPLINFKSPAFFAKFSAMGTLSVIYLVIFVIAKASRWGFHVNMVDKSADDFVPHFKSTFPALTGTLALAYFIHNCIISVMRNQKNPQNNIRDLSIAYMLVVSTYLFIGSVFYASFPLPKECIEDNLLNNISTSDLLAFLARFFLFFQLVTVCPLVIYIFRVQFMHHLFGNIYPSLKHVVVLNMCLMAICILFAVFMPSIGTIIRFSGALSGFAYIFSLPCLTHIVALKRQNTLTVTSLIFHCILIVIGLANFLSQFFISADL